MQREEAAVEQRHREAGEDGHADHGRDRRREADREGVAPAVGVRALADALGLEVLGGVRLDGGDAEQVVVEPRASAPAASRTAA